MTAYLVVRAGRSRFGLPLGDILEVLEVADVAAVPGAHPALRGVSPVHGRLLPRVQLAALLPGAESEGGASPTVVVARGGGRTVALEVDDVDLATQDEVLPLPAAWDGPSAVGVVRYDEGLIPLLDLRALVARLEAPAGSRG